MMSLMFRDIRDYQVVARDAELGHIKDVFFDDLTWRVRYLVADTAKWLPGRKVLLSPQSVLEINTGSKEALFKLFRHEVESSPSIEDHLPVSRQHEQALSDHYGWTPYWLASGNVPLPVATFEDSASQEDDSNVRSLVSERSTRGDSHLRSLGEIEGYRIVTNDDDLFYVDDFVLLIDHDWKVEHLVISPGKWLHSKQVFLPSFLVNEINCRDRVIKISIPAEALESAPVFEGGYGKFNERAIASHYAKLASDQSALAGRRGR